MDRLDRMNERMHPSTRTSSLLLFIVKLILDYEVFTIIIITLN